MGIVSGIVTFIIIWWTALFCVLPWGNHANPIKSDTEFGGAPANPRIAKKFAITTIISILLWLVVFAMIKANVIDFYDMARDLAVKENIE